MSNKELIQSIQTRLRDYRKHDGKFYRVTNRSIEQWIKQFESKSRHSILTDLDNIFKKRYFSRARTKRVLTNFIVDLADEFRFKTVRSFVKNCIFLNLQPPGRSQCDLLEVIRPRFLAVIIPL
jgi:hypothetical protein